MLLDIDVQGAVQLCTKYPDAITIFIMPPSPTVLRQRLEKRGTDTQDIMDKRMVNAEKEMAQRDAYRHIVVNDRLEDAVEALVAIFRGHHH